MPIPLQFDGPQRARLRVALLDALDNQFDFSAFLSDRLDQKIGRLTSPLLSYENQLVDVLNKANGQGWIADLLAAALEAVPRNPKLGDFACRVGLASASAKEVEDAHQRMVQNGVQPLDSALFRSRLGVLEAQTCRIEIELEQGQTSYGTGFLLGPSVVMTNFHVMEPVYQFKAGKTTAGGYSARPEKVTVRFDYKRLPEGVLNTGVTYSLAAAWDLDRSDTHRPVDADAPAARLDYALIRLAEPAGGEKAGKKDATTGEKRGWMTPLFTYAFAADSPLNILEHPKGDPLKLGQATNGVIGVTATGTRLRHRVNTEAGSSGSPCFNHKLELVALHHAGDPDFEKPASWNQAIPFGAISQLMDQRGTKALLGT